MASIIDRAPRQHYSLAPADGYRPVPNFQSEARWVSGGAWGNLAVWDPVTGAHDLVPEPDDRSYSRSGAVLCAVAGCDHRACRGGPFLVVFVDNTNAVARAWVYSSEAAAWSLPASVHIGEHSFVERKRGALVGEELFFLLNMATAILKFDLSHSLSVIASPLVHGESVVLMSLEDGSLGLAGIKGSALHLWSRKVNPEGVATWARYRVIELETLLPTTCKLNHQTKAIGFAEGVGVLLLGEGVNAFTFELKSEQVNKVCTPGYYHYHQVFPYTSFYVPAFTSSKLQFPEERN